MSWIKLHRDLLKHEIWDIKPFSLAQAWIYLICKATYEQDKNVFFNGKTIKTKRSELCTSVRKLAADWGWSKTKTTAFLEFLIEEKMIRKITNTKRTLITIVNYDRYQGCEDTEGDIERDTKRTQKRHPYPIIRNKEKKNKSNTFKIPEITEIQEYIKKNNYNVDAKRFYNFYDSKNWMVGKNKMSKWKSAVANWHKDDNGKSNEPIPEYFKKLKIGFGFIHNNQAYRKTGDTTCKLDVFNSKDIDIRSLL